MAAGGQQRLESAIRQAVAGAAVQSGPVPVADVRSLTAPFFSKVSPTVVVSQVRRLRPRLYRTSAGAPLTASVDAAEQATQAKRLSCMNVKTLARSGNISRAPLSREAFAGSPIHSQLEILQPGQARLNRLNFVCAVCHSKQALTSASDER